MLQSKRAGRRTDLVMYGSEDFAKHGRTGSAKCRRADFAKRGGAGGAR